MDSALRTDSSARSNADGEARVRVIAGSGRSGTTWILDCLADSNNLCPIFEPLHPNVSDIGNLYAHRALAAGEKHPELERFLREVSLGKAHRLWTRYRGRKDLLFPRAEELTSIDDMKVCYHRWRHLLRDAPKLWSAARRSEPIVKFIRANRMLDWLAESYSSRIVLVVRHPGAVVGSQLRLGPIWDPRPVLDRYRRDQVLDRQTAGKYRIALRSQLTPVQGLTLNWIIENQWALDAHNTCPVPIFFYEDLRADPDLSWRRLCEALCLKSLPDTTQRSRPSQQSWGTAHGPDSTELRKRWKLSIEDCKSMQTMMDDMGVTMYSMSEAMPRVCARVPPNVTTSETVSP
jgi:hypothetical protein